MVGRPLVQSFYGGLAGQRAATGVFITSYSFTAEEAEFARSVEKIELADGRRLADVVIEDEVGITTRSVKVPSWTGTTSTRSDGAIVVSRTEGQQLGSVIRFEAQ